MLYSDHMSEQGLTKGSALLRRSVPNMKTPDGDLPINSAAVLFSGGRDSSLAACLLASAGTRVHLFTTSNGATIKADIADYRFNELRTSFPDTVVDRTIVSSVGLFKRIALEGIEADFALFKKNLIPVGDALATHTLAMQFALNRGLDAIASGYAQYESEFPEQMPEIIALTRQFVAEYGLKYLTPVATYTHRKQVKRHLLDFGISTQSLEGISIFADTFSTPSPEVVASYVLAKLPICRDYLSSASETGLYRDSHLLASSSHQKDQ